MVNVLQTVNAWRWLMRRFAETIAILTLLVSPCVEAATYDPSGPVLFILEGDFIQATTYTYTISATPDPTPSDVAVTMPLPVSRFGATQTLQMTDLTYNCTPEPSSVQQTTDRSGNVWSTATWLGATGTIECVRSLNCEEETHFYPMVSWWPEDYPLDWSSFPEDVTRWLEPDPYWIQSDDPEIVQLAQTLSTDVGLEIEVVGRVLAWVQDNVRIAQCDEPIPHGDAAWTVRNRMGNCMNFANLVAALLRAAGIPTTTVTGLVAVSEAPGVSHAWISVYFADLGWVEFESSSWMPSPTLGAVPTTLFTPQHITVYSGDARGISNTPFAEENQCSLQVLHAPRELQFVEAEVEPGDAITWVVTLRSRSYYEVYEWEYGYRDVPISLSVSGVPSGWRASVSLDEYLLSRQDVGASPSRSFLLTVVPPDDAEVGTQAVITLTARDTGLSGDPVVGVVTVAVSIKAP